MNEDLNLLRQLAGLEVQEDAPVEFETPLSIKDVKFTPPSKSSAFMSIANRFPEGADVNDPEVKKEEFIKVLLKAPLSLLSEINERISPADDNGLAISTKLSSVIDNLGRDGDLKDLSDDDRAFTIKIVKLAIDNMDLEAGDDSPTVDELEGNTESIDLSDIRESYGASKFKPHMMYDPKTGEGKMAKVEQDHLDMKAKGWGHEKPKKEESVEEGRMSDIHQDANSMDKEEFAKEHPMFADDWEGMQNDDNAEDEPRDDGSPAYKKYIGKHKKDESLESYNFIEEAEKSIEESLPGDLQKAYNQVAHLKDKHVPGISNAGYNFEYYAPYFSDALKRYGDIKSIEANNEEFIDIYIKELSEVAKMLGTYHSESKGSKPDYIDIDGDGVEESSEDSGEGSIRDMEDDELMDYVGQREEDLIDDIQQHIAPDFLHKDNYEESFEKYREEVLEPAAQELSQDKAMDQMPDEMESIENTSNNAFEAAMGELKKLAGL